MSSFFTTPKVFISAILLRTILLFYGLFQDAHSPLKYTDIDYYVFTDAARYVSRGLSPYQRETYRYTPLLAWLLLPTTWGGTAWFSFGKVVFALSDVVAGWLIVLVLRSPAGGGMSTNRALKFASIWLLNPMVATISTRGSSEDLPLHLRHLNIPVSGLLELSLDKSTTTTATTTGPTPPPTPPHPPDPPTPLTSTLPSRLIHFLTPPRLTLTLTSLLTFLLLNLLMHALYSTPFLTHTYLHHLTRIDHRHNFSPYNTLLYLSSSQPLQPHHARFESLAFIPQLLLSAVLIPLVLAKRDLPGAMLAQTYAFVAFNKVCTSQYFLWHLILLPLHLPTSSLFSAPSTGIPALALWTCTQALWLHQAYRLEFLGKSTFVPGLWVGSLLFFAVNVWVLGVG
ncbi:MAG: GPI mannosyltransferase [Lasallia pustulata]|uniref:GPI mannosyltransferase 1 n=1 Tax=Lasallia pustulata TaxID=136370 RepID=A0A5M8PMU5_9LECA|nr:MAG: GPI mannosyltransferase [Lasallia pustulata]